MSSLPKAQARVDDADDDVDHEILLTADGQPVVNDLIPSVEETSDGPISLRWVGQETIGDVQVLLDMGRAQSVDEALGVFCCWRLSVWNSVIADADGHVAYQMCGSVPRRKIATRGTRPANDTGHTWQGYWDTPILPGEKLDFHRHNYVAIYYWIEGEGYTVVADDGIDREEHRVYWKPGDVTTSPAWSNHAHVCTSEEPAFQLAIHDFPELCYKRVMMSEDPDGHEHLRHMVGGVVPSFNALDTVEDLENRSQKIRMVTES